MTKNPIAEAFAAVIGGIITGVLLQVASQKLTVLNAPLIYYASIILIAIFDYVAGIIEAHVFGFLFPITLISFGAFFNEWEAFFAGAIAFVVYLAGVIRAREGFT